MNQDTIMPQTASVTTKAGLFRAIKENKNSKALQLHQLLFQMNPMINKFLIFLPGNLYKQLMNLKTWDQNFIQSMKYPIKNNFPRLPGLRSVCHKLRIYPIKNL